MHDVIVREVTSVFDERPDEGRRLGRTRANQDAPPAHDASDGCGRGDDS
jgi:hypothetical protein